MGYEQAQWKEVLPWQQKPGCYLKLYSVYLNVLKLQVLSFYNLLFQGNSFSTVIKNSLLTIEFENKIWTKHFVGSVSGIPKENMGSTDQMVLVSVWEITYAYET